MRAAWKALWVGCAAVACAGYGLQVRSARRSAGHAAVDEDRLPDPSTAADLSDITPGGPRIACEPWDIGTGVAGFIWRAPQPRAAVLLQVGWGDYTHRWVNHAGRLIPHLLARGVNVYAFDMRGSGRSPGPRGLTDLDRAIQDHLAARRAASQNREPLFLMGHSLGALITATSVVQDQRDVMGMVLLSGALKYDVGVLLRLLARVGARLTPRASVPGSAAAAVEVLTRDAAAAELLEADPALHRGRLPFLTAGGGAKHTQRNFRRYPAVQVPVLAVHGTDDEGTDPAGSRDLITVIGSPDRSLQLVQGGRHSILDDVDAEATLAVVLHWLEERMPGQLPGREL